MFEIALKYIPIENIHTIISYRDIKWEQLGTLKKFSKLHGCNRES